MPRNNMPADWEPPAPAWQSVWEDTDEPMVAGYFGIQCERPDLLDNWAQQAFHGEYSPLSLEQASYVDQAGVASFVYIAYWRRTAYNQWWCAHSAWWSDKARTEEGVGYWREIIQMSFDRFETLHSTEHPHGVSVLADGVKGPIEEHGYPGGARDRIPLSAISDLRNVESVREKLCAKSSDGGKRVLVIPPEHACIIRSGQNWSFCNEEEKAYYLQNVHPVLIEGMTFLRDNPGETNCYCMRFMDKKDAGWADMEQSFGLGYASDIYAFENWAKSHPTHLAIFGNFMKMLEHFGVEMKLRLWHEVSVLPEEGCEFEYICCQPQTGLLDYADV